METVADSFCSSSVSGVAGNDSADEALQRRDQRLPQLLQLSLGGTLLGTLVNIAASNWLNSAILVVTACVLLLSRGLIHRGSTQRGAALMLYTLTAMVATFAALNGGIRDTSLLVLPVILLFAGMFMTRRALLVLTGTMLAIVAISGFAHLAGWHVRPPGPVTATTIVNLTIILTVTAFSVYLVTGDLRRALTALRRENRRVQRSREQLQHLAHHDALTGLPNRSLARDRFEMALAQARRNQRRVALVFLDLDHFKHVNDSLGHVAGDALLQEAGRRLQAVVRASDTVCRLGGDEFLLVLADLADAQAAAAVADKVLEAMNRCFVIGGSEVVSSASAGIALAPDDGVVFDEVLKNVDIAMYEAKATGGDALRFFDPQMNAAIGEHNALLTGMRSGLARGEFALHYQPQHCLSSGRIVGCEALLRWQHPELGAVPPARFIPVAEKSGFIVELGAWVMHEACRQAALWEPMLADDFQVSVNLSPVQFRRGSIEQVVHDALESSGLAPHRLELELTESMLLEDTRDLSGALERLRSAGLRFAIDDFGTGYSNLGYLKRFEVGRLKIDQSFVRRLTQDAHDAAIVGAIVQMSRSLRLTTIAEGVEDEATRAHLVALGCTQGQGWLWSKALPAAQFERYLIRNQAATSLLLPRVPLPA